jgi:hypothetical protein
VNTTPLWLDALAARARGARVPRAALDALAEAAFADLTPLGRLAFAAAEEEALDDALDAALDTPKTAHNAIAALARAGSAWSHDALTAALGKDASRFAAARVLALAGDLEPVESHYFETERALSTHREMLRALGPAFAEDFDLLDDFSDALDGVHGTSPRVDALVDATRAARDPVRFVRDALMGDAQVDWLTDDVLAADVLADSGSTWLETLAILSLSEAREARAFASLLAVVGVLADPGELEVDLDAHARLYDALDGEPDAWAPLASELGLLAPLALGDEDTTRLLVGAALYERFASRGEAPAIAGLPLSATFPEGLDLGAARDLLSGGAPEAESVAAVVRTLCDARGWLVADRPRVESLVPAIKKLRDHPEQAVALAARRALHVVNPSDAAEPEVASERGWLAETARGEGLAGAWAAAQLAVSGDLEEVANLWAEGPIARAELYAALFEEVAG